MIDYETFVKIKVFKDQHGLKCSQISRELNLDYRTVEKWIEKKQYSKETRRDAPANSIRSKGRSNVCWKLIHTRRLKSSSD